MKLRILIFFGLVLLAFSCRAQDGQPATYNDGWYLATNAISCSDGISTSYPLIGNPTYPGGTSAIAEAITPDISALARNLDNDPTRIFNYVHDHIRYVHYFGSHKGAEMTLLERSGNDFDQCSLLVALLTQAGFSPTYKFGMISIPYSATNQQDYMHWVGATLPNTNWNSTFTLVEYINGYAGYPYTQYFTGDTNDPLFHHVWVQVTIGGTNYSLDPSFKVNLPIGGVGLDSAMQLNTNTFLSAVTNGSTATPDYVQGLNEANLRSTLGSYNSNLLGYIQSNYPNYSVQQIASGQTIVPSTGQPLGQATPFTVQTDGGSQWPVSTWTNIPTNLMAVLIVNLPGTNNSFLIPGLAGSRLSIVTTSNGVAQLWQEDTPISSVTNTGSGATFTPTIGIQHPFGTNWDFTIPGFYPARWPGDDQSVSAQPYQRSNATYIVLYGLDANSAWLTKRQQQLDAYLQEGYPVSSRQVTTETLNVMGLGWLMQTELAQELIAGQTATLEHYHHRIGRMAVESGMGYYIDVYEQIIYTVANNVTGSAALFPQNQAFQITTYFDSAMEHGIIEQMQNTNLVGASTVKLLELASTNNEKIYLATSTNWSSGANVSGAISNYNNGGLYSNLISQGYSLLLPQNGSIQVAGTNSWAGAGYVAYQNTPNGVPYIKMIVGGGYYGAWVSDPEAVPSPSVIEAIDFTQPVYFSAQSATTAVATPPGADPVNTVDGSFQISSTDLALGGMEPRGLNLSRSYSSARRNANLAGMTPGWLHNYYCTALPTSAPIASLGDTTPQQMVPMMVALRTALNIYNSSQISAENGVIMALIAKWSLDQITAGAVSVSLGEATIQFIKQPNGSYTPPANCTMSLIKTNGAYWLMERHGRTFKFATNSFLTNIVDQYGQGLTFTYNSSNWVLTATDWKNRSLTFTYSGSPLHLTSVADSTGRSVSYGYTANANSQLDLTSYTDPESKTSSFTYDTNHQVITTFDALSHLVVSNVYDGYGRVTTQYTQGDTNKTWQVFCSGSDTLMVDPAGGVQEYVFDDKSRQTGSYDALGDFSQLFYDGQDHVVMTVSPLDETNQFVYDGYHNLLAAVDPLGYSNQFFYDTNFNQIRAVDKNGHTNYFGYNPKFQTIGSTNGAGDWVTNYYDPTYGFLNSRTDPGGTTSYGYDTWGQLSSVTYPSGLGTNLFLNSTNGDVLVVTNARGLTNGFQYNLRRQLTQTSGPTNLSTKIVYDAVGNVATNIDALNHATAFAWSPTRHLLATTLPVTPQGTPIVTNVYDSRDWLIKATDPLQNPATNAYDFAGRLLSGTDPLNRTTTMTYDKDGRKLTVTNAAMQGIAQLWNARGQLTATVDQMGKNILKGYDAVGNQILFTNRNGKVWQFQFDSANRLAATITPTLKSNNLVFDHQGLLRTNTDFNRNPTMFGYDALGRLTSRTDLVATSTFVYDRNGNLATNSEGGQSLVRQFDAYDRLSSYTDAGGNLIKYGYDTNGNLTSLVYPGNRNVTYAYDNLNRLTNVTDWAARQTIYTYDLDSRVTSITRPNGTVRSNSYDAAGQLTNIIEQTATHAPIAFFKLNWNSAARVQWEFMAPTNQPYALPTRALAYDADNRLTNFNGAAIVNDNNGNMTSGPMTNGTLFTYEYDARNRLTNAGGVSYGYDAANNRVAITNSALTNTFVVDPKTSQVLMRIKNGVTNYYVYGIGLIYEEDDTATSAATLTYHFDYRGSTVALTDGNGNVTDRIQYSAYGVTTLRVGTNDTPFQYNGRYGVQTDPNGLLYMRARYYNPYICRFINADPSGFSGGLNFYAYANGDPISLTDPFGLSVLGDSTGTSLLGGVNNVAGVTVPNPNPTTYSLNTTGTAGYPNSQVMDLSSMPTPTVAPNAPGAFIGPTPNYTYNETMTLGSGLDPSSPIATGMASLNAAILTSALPLPGGSSGGLVGVSEAEASALARQIYGIQVDGQDAVSLVEAFGSRAGSTYRGAATAASDLDIRVTITAPEYFGTVQSEMNEIQSLFNATKGFPLEPTYVIPGLPAPVLLKTPFIPLKP